MTQLGPIQFETVDGTPSALVTYTKHPLLRPYQIAFQGTWYVQNRCDNGVWVYRAIAGTPGSFGTDPAVKED